MRGSTVPHRETGLVWTVIALVALGSHQAGGGRWSLLVPAGQANGNIVVLALSVRRGTGGVTVGNGVPVAVAGLGV